MFTAVCRQFVVEAPLEAAWHHFALAERWPTWHLDLKSVSVDPPGELGARSVATLHMRRGPDTTFRMVEFDPCRHWKWVSRIFWFDFEYDHRFEALDAGHTRITLEIRIRGIGESVFGRMVGAATRRSHDKGLPLLQQEMKRLNRAGFTPAAGPG